MKPFCHAMILVAASASLSFAADPAHPEVASKQVFLNNEKIKIGVDLSSGGSLFWFSELPSDRNLLNHADRGRFIQQSYYGKPDGSLWVKKPWCWNPVQGGDYKGKPARLVESKQTETSLYVRSIPVNWAGGQDMEDCRMEEWITLNDNIAQIRFRFSYRGTDTHPAKHQELPAVFVDYDLTDLITYSGDQPWKDQPLNQTQPGWPNESRKTTENWAAFVGKDARGMGVLFPGTERITTYRFKGASGPKGGGCSYFAPIRTMSITPGMTFEYSVFLTIGTADEIRGRFKPIALKAIEEAATKPTKP